MLQDKIFQDAQTRMQKSIDALHTELSKLRVGRATPSLLDHITVDYYGSPMPLNQVAAITATDARTLTVAPWEKSMTQKIEKAILTSDLGLNPSASGDVLRIPLPPLTEERRKDFTKIVKSEVEEAKVAVRNIRRDVNTRFKEGVKAKEFTEDDERRAQEKIQKLTDSMITKIDEIGQHKETELMEI